MTWFKLDDQFHSNVKVIVAGNAAIGLYCRLGTYCADKLTDGFVPTAVARSMGSRKELAGLTLCSVPDTRPLLDVVDHGYLMRDYLEHNPSRATILAERAKAKDRMDRLRGVRPNNGRTNGVDSPAGSHVPDPVPLVVHVTESSVRTEVDDDDDFSTAIDAIVAAKELAHPPSSNPEQWRRVVRANTIAEEGERVKRLLKHYGPGVGNPNYTAEVLAGVVLEHPPLSRHPDDCQKCDQGSVEVVDNEGVTRYQPCSERVVAS